MTLNVQPSRPGVTAALIATLCLSQGAGLASTSSSSLGARVVAYCEAHLGQKVGSGECAALAFQALKAARAKPRAGPDSPHRGDYVWGREVCRVEATADGPRRTGDFASVLPGDVMQYRDVRFVRFHADHHTAVVKSIDAATGKVRAFAQNSGGRRFVVELDVPLLNLSQGWIRIYRPIPTGH